MQLSLLSLRNRVWAILAGSAVAAVLIGVVAFLLIDVVTKIGGIGDLQTALLLAGGVALLLVLFSARLLVRWVAAPIEEMAAVAKKVEAGGEGSSFAQGRRTEEIGQLAGALESMRVRLNEQRSSMATDARQTSTMSKFMDAVTFVDDERALATAMLEALGDLTEVENRSVHITTARHDKAEMVAQAGAVDPGDVPIRDLDNCPGVRRGALYTTPNMERALGAHCPVYPVLSGALACVPLTSSAGVVGVAHVHWPEPRTVPVQTRVALGRIGQQAGSQIATRRLLATLRERSRVDAQTGLMTRTAFDDVLEKSTSSRRRGHRVALLLLDIDNFREFNDRNGGPAGDDALRFFARTLGASLRFADQAARYGGEEFAVLLPEMSTEQAVDVADRIRSKVEATNLPVGRGTDERLTVSIGVASAPEEAENRIGLLRAADAALHEAKLAGRNRVVPATDILLEDDDAPDEPFVRAHMVTIKRDISSAAEDTALVPL